MTFQEELTRQNERLRLLLSLTNKITSNLDLREVVRSISANMREVMLGDLVSVSLPDAELGKIRVYALDFPGSPGIVKEGMLVSLTGPGKAIFESLKTEIANTTEPYLFPGRLRKYSHSLRNRKRFALSRL